MAGRERMAKNINWLNVYAQKTCERSIKKKVFERYLGLTYSQPEPSLKGGAHTHTPHERQEDSLYAKGWRW